jgi:hypothetical protein
MTAIQYVSQIWEVKPCPVPHKRKLPREYRP